MENKDRVKGVGLGLWYAKGGGRIDNSNKRGARYRRRPAIPKQCTRIDAI